MNMDKYIADLLGMDSYVKGRRYYSWYVDLSSQGITKEGYSFKFSVESERTYRHYKVQIDIKDCEIVSYSCNCEQFKGHHTCKHVAASIYKYREEIARKLVNPMKLSNMFLSSFKSDTSTKVKNNIKEAMTLKLELVFDDYVTYKLHVGLKKTYVLNTEAKLRNFVNAYRNGGDFKLGKEFTYNRDRYFFNSDDEELFDFLISAIASENSYYNSEAIYLSPRELSALLNKLQGHKFSIRNVGEIKDIIYSMPTELNLDLKDDIYHLTVDDISSYHLLNNSLKYIAYNHILYVVPDKYREILMGIFSYGLDEVVFEKKDINLFKDGLLKEVRNNISISENVKDIVVGIKPECELYFDLKRDKITCDCKFDYKDTKIDYFDNIDTILRDEEYETEVISRLVSYGFEIGNKKIVLDEFELVYDFLSDGIMELSEDYKVFTTKKIDNTNIIKNSHVQSNFSIGASGIMSYSFDADNINLDELDKVLSSLKSNKKYYKLKNGNVIDLENNEQLNELNNLMTDLQVSGNLAEGEVEIPKYRAFYIDSLKNNKYKSINTDNSFDTFINNFKEYKDASIKLNKKDEEILRDYQRDGIKWLYTLYKCDLGGILADEMGLGKSIQTIMFIKLILKEKKDAKIMIVCPTALVYNWKKEFDKFGKELKYVTVADNKAKRKEIIKDFDKYNIFITSYGLIRNDNDEYEDKNFELCVIDEAQTIKNYQAGMTKEIKKIKARTKIALTGTPVENSVLELWSIFDFIMPGYLNSVNKFREYYGIKDVDEASLERLSRLNYQIKPFILRRKKSDVTKDLPDKIENTIYLDLPDYQKALYLKVLRESKEEMEELILTEGFKKARFKILQLLMKLRQICIDPSILYSNYKKESIKFEKLLEVVQNYIEEGHKILIFSSFKKVLDKVEKMFKKNKISNYMIAGDVKGKVRTELVEKFNKDDTNCFLITLKAGGTGLNLTSADVVIHLDIWWNPQVENQATDRAHRIGQKNKVTVIKMVTKGTIEERIIELQNKKKILSDNLIEGKDNSEVLSSLSEKDIKNLLASGEDD